MYQLLVVIAAATLQDGWTPLMKAAEFGNTATLQNLLAYGADMNIQQNVSTAPQPELHPHTCNHIQPPIWEWMYDSILPAGIPRGFSVRPFGLVSHAIMVHGVQFLQLDIQSHTR